MNQRIIKEIATNLNISSHQVSVVLELLSGGNTVPFIARYRKEQTGNLDEEVIGSIEKHYTYQVSLQERKDDVIRLLKEKDLLTDELEKAINAAEKLVEVEDLYRPFKEKKKTKATEAIAKGLQPFADWLLTFPSTPVEEEAKKYLNEQVITTDEAIRGAQYIISEVVSDEPKHRKVLRERLFNLGVIETSLKKEGKSLDENKVYENYYEYKEPVKAIKAHRVLAINRAEKEKVISVKIDVEREFLIAYLNKEVIKKQDSTATTLIKEAVEDALKRLIFPSIEREIRAELTSKAEAQAIAVFGDNLEKLLLQPPLKNKIVLGVDPAFRTGCKLSVISANGAFLDKAVIYPHEKSVGAAPNEVLIQKANQIVDNLVEKYHVDVIAIGNGTASRETEAFIAKLIHDHQLKVQYVIVNEAGASVYSASELAREEFPDFSVEERSAASIARRIQDPLSELVKIDPKSIGVGQYQHDVSQKELNEQLNTVVVNAVNKVGVDVNTASKALLKYVSGLNNKIAENIVTYRNAKKGIKNRQELKKIPGLGEKAFQQSAGFLRINNGDEVLDMTGIHPESYRVAKKIMQQFKISKEMIGHDEVRNIIGEIDRNSLIEELAVDRYTLNDILDAFIAPLRDPRDQFPQPILKSDILKIEDLKVGMALEGTVRNVIDFGAFVDIGLKNDGLVHISHMANRFVKHPKEVVSVGDIVTVYVLSVDLAKNKVSLSLLPTK